MEKLQIAFRSFFKQKSNAIKIVSLSIGLAMSLVLIAKVLFEQSYNAFFPDRERIYEVVADYSAGGGLQQAFLISGGIAPDMKAEIPDVEAATRFTGIAYDDMFVTGGQEKFQATFMVGDTGFFDIFSRPILSGNARETLARPMYAVISSALAEKMGGADKVLGQTIEIESSPGNVLTVGGVFEALPVNTHLNFDVVVSMASIERFLKDTSRAWSGDERYQGYVKLAPGADPRNVEAALRAIRDKHMSQQEGEGGIAPDYSLLPLTDIYTSDPVVRRSMMLFSFLALILLLTSIMNYSLIVISAQVNRSKEMSVHKCYGASKNDIYKKLLSEALVDFLFVLAVSAILIVAFQQPVLSLAGTAIADLFTWKSCGILAVICLVVYFISGIIPGYLYSRIPVSGAFRTEKEGGLRWKQAMLFAQFIAAAFFVTTLTVVGRQYKYVVGYDLGYNYENLAYCNLSGVNPELRRKALDEVSRLPEVERVATSDDLLFDRYKENDIGLPGRSEALFRVGDLYSVNNGYLEVMEIPVIEGRSFREESGISNEVMVSRSFVEKMKNLAGWSDGVIGKEIMVSGHGPQSETPFTICGVYEEIHLGTLAGLPSNTSILFYDHQPSHNLLIRMHRLSPENMEKIAAVLTGLLPDKEINVRSYAAQMEGRYADSRKFRDSVLIGSVVAMLICLIGLIGYTNNEMNRRRRETAIRKVNGATVLDIQRLFAGNVIPVIIPALFVGGVASYFAAGNWLERFTERAPLTLPLFLLCAGIVLVIILAVVSLNSYRSATENPAKIIKG